MKFSSHFLHSLSLLLLMTAGLAGLVFFRFNHPVQFLLAAAMGICYTAWGIVHHYLKGDIHPKIIAEYLLVALFAVLLFASLLYRS